MRARLLRFATARPRAFVVTSPGATRTRLRLEAELRRRGGTVVASPAAATTLVECGSPGAGLADAAEVVWSDMPGPRARVRLAETASSEDVASALDGAGLALADVDAQWADARERAAWAPEGDHGGHGGGHEGHGGGHEGHGGGHEHHMGNPMGLAMADRADDRDGLKLDVLHVPLGPALRDWPAGLAVHLTLQGDLVQAADVSVMEARAGDAPFWDGADQRPAARRLDSLGRLLAVAGWDGAAARARALRDAALDGASGDALAPAFERFARRTRRSRTLRWMLRGVTVPPGDAFTRLTGWLDEAGAALDDTEPPSDVPAGEVLAALPGLLEGTDLAAARLTVAALDPDLDTLAVPAPAGGA